MIPIRIDQEDTPPPNPDQFPTPPSDSPKPDTPSKSSSSSSSDNEPDVPEPVLPSALGTEEGPRCSGRKRKQMEKYTSGSSSLKTATSEGDLMDCDIAYLSMVKLYTQASSVGKPRSHTEALQSPQSEDWKNAEAEEITSLESHGNWEVVPRPDDVNVISCKWVYQVKYGADGEVTCYKARLVACGFTQIHGLDYSETFTPVTQLETLRLL